MGFSRRRFRRRANNSDHPARPQDTPPAVNPETTGAESAYLKSLVDSRTKVTVVLADGERLRGYLRYYDSHCFSIGITAEGPRFFLRKEHVSYISEEAD